MKNTYKIMIIILSFSLICIALTGCISGNKESTATESSETASANQASETEEESTAIISLSGNSAEISGSGAVYENGNIIISKGGAYTFSGELSEGKITVDADDESVTLILDGVKITSPDSSAVNVVKAESVTLNIKDGTENELADASKYDFGNSYSDEAEEEPNACVFSKSDLTITGGGKLTVTGNYSNGIKSKDLLTIENTDLSISSANNALTGNDGVIVNGNTIDITAKGDGIHSNSDVEINSGTVTIKSDDDAIHADNSVTVNSGKINLSAHEGLEGTLITINDGTITIDASDDGINAAKKTDGVTPTVEINGGEITITMGSGDSDAIDSNGDIIINGGKISITGQSGFDYDGKAEFNGGEIYLNGEQVTEITNLFASGMGGMRGAGNGQSEGNGDFARREGGRKTGEDGFNPGQPPELPEQ